MRRKNASATSRPEQMRPEKRRTSVNHSRPPTPLHLLQDRSPSPPVAVVSSLWDSRSRRALVQCRQVPKVRARSVKKEPWHNTVYRNTESLTTTSEYVTPAITSNSVLKTSERTLKTPPIMSMNINVSEIPMTSRRI